MRVELMTFCLQGKRSNQLSYNGKKGSKLRIESRTSCTQSKNHTTRPFWQNMHRPGIEPGSPAWKAGILTTIPTMLKKNIIIIIYLLFYTNLYCRVIYLICYLNATDTLLLNWFGF